MLFRHQKDADQKEERKEQNKHESYSDEDDSYTFNEGAQWTQNEESPPIWFKCTAKMIDF